MCNVHNVHSSVYKNRWQANVPCSLLTVSSVSEIGTVVRVSKKPLRTGFMKLGPREVEVYSVINLHLFSLYYSPGHLTHTADHPTLPAGAHSAWYHQPSAPVLRHPLGSGAAQQVRVPGVVPTRAAAGP